MLYCSSFGWNDIAQFCYDKNGLIITDLLVQLEFYLGV